jgi:hypothetical protein|nr:MAG TPA: ASCH domain protein [Caudoviricetes sp.]
MKKIMFNDKLGLTQAVLEGLKTMTRRIFYIPDKLVPYLDIDDIFDIVDDCIIWKDKSDNIRMTFEPKYKVGEVVAIAQSYMDVDQFHRKGKNAAYLEYLDSILPELKLYPGWGNKMFVKADLMPHHIKITGIKVERLQDISDEDCLKEGIIHVSTFLGQKIYHTPHVNGSYLSTNVAQEAFAYLIDKVSGKGAWESNPFVFAYEFVLFD